jgi:hypothetical protein
MDRISYKCALEINDDLAIPVLNSCAKTVKVWRYPESGSGGHYCDPYIDGMRWDDDPTDDYDDTIIAPNWDELRKTLSHYKPPLGILVDFEAIDSIDEYAKKLVEYIKEAR